MDPTETQDAAQGDSGQEPDPTAQTGDSSGDSTIPEEYRPYIKMLPWEKIPEELHEECLEMIKPMHAAKTRAEQKVGQLEGQLGPVQAQLEFLGQLTKRPDFEDYLQGKLASAGQQQQAEQTPGQNGLNSLTGLGLEEGDVNALQTAISGMINNALAPVLEQQKGLTDGVAKMEYQTQMAEIRKFAEAKGYPLPDSKIQDIHDMLFSRRATNLDDAYTLAVKGEIPDIIEKQTRDKINQERQTRANASTNPPRRPQLLPVKESQYTGKDAVWKALADSKKEMNLG